MWCKTYIAGRFFGLVTKHACDTSCDGRQTDGQNYDSQDPASIAASRGKNQAMQSHGPPLLSKVNRKVIGCLSFAVVRRCVYSSIASMFVSLVSYRGSFDNLYFTAHHVFFTLDPPLFHLTLFYFVVNQIQKIKLLIASRLWQHWDEPWKVPCFTRTSVIMTSHGHDE